MKKTKQCLLAIFLAVCFLVINISTIVAPADNFDNVSDGSDNVQEKIESADSIEAEQASPIVLESLNTADCMISKYVNATAFNDAKHIKRLVNEEELDTYVFLNSDGTKSVYYMDENVKFFDKNGNVKEKDVTLVSESDGYGIVRNEFDLHIPNSATSGISMSYNGYDVKITPQSTARTAPARQVDETIVYDGFFGTNTCLVYTPMLSGIKEDVIMKAYIPNAEFSFVLDTDGLGLYNNDEGYYLAESESSEVILRLGKVIIYDAIGKPDYGTMNVTTVAEGQKYILSLSAPEEFLTDPTTVYPVTIDPTLTVSDSVTGSNAIEDTILFSNRPSRNYGDYVYLSIGYVDSTYGVGRVAVKLPGLYESNIFKTVRSSNISSVKFYGWDTSGNGGQIVDLYRITSPEWDEYEVTYSDSITYSTATNWRNRVFDGTWNCFDITTLAQGWKDGTYSAESGFIMINTNETSASNKKAICSSEYSNSTYHPYVVMTYENYTATVNNYYDNGYSIYYNESSDTSVANIEAYLEEVAQRYNELLCLTLNYNIVYYNSTLDQCKGAVTASNIDVLCRHEDDHTSRTTVLREFYLDTTGNITTTNVYWSCHRIISQATNGTTNENRSYSWRTVILMIERSLSYRERNSKSVLMHELNHQYGASDHYHELADAEDESSCKFKEICSDCGDNPRPKTCIMYRCRMDISLDEVLCSGCKDDIIAHLEGHH